jgi:hypothetical protein
LTLPAEAASVRTITAAPKLNSDESTLFEVDAHPANRRHLSQAAARFNRYTPPEIGSAEYGRGREASGSTVTATRNQISGSSMPERTAQHRPPSTRQPSLRGQEGQSLVIVVLAMFVVIAIAAAAIDIATWYQKHHQAQVSADAAALAAANCLSRESSLNTSTNTCTAPTDTASASGVATTMAQKNSIPAQTVSFGKNSTGTVTSVTVTTATQSAPFFARLAGISSANIAARAVAAVTWKFTDCTTAANGCLMFYAAANTCSSTSPAISIQVGQSNNFNGGILTNGNIDDSYGNGGTFNGPVTYGAGSSCSTSTGTTNFKGTLNAGSTQQTTDYGTSSSPNWLINYATQFPACGSTSTYACTGPAVGGSNTPSYCTYAAASFSPTSVPDGVYCAVGTGTPSNPATWNGSISLPSNTGASTSPVSVTLIGGTVTLNSNSVYKPYMNNLVAYATSTSATAFVGTGGNLTFTGDVFVPNGGASLTGGNVNFSGFVQAQTIVDQGGNQTGSGPAYSGGTTLVPGSDSLSQ